MVAKIKVSPDSRVMRKRAAARLRQQRCRARKRAASMVQQSRGPTSRDKTSCNAGKNETIKVVHPSGNTYGVEGSSTALKSRASVPMYAKTTIPVGKRHTYYPSDLAGTKFAQPVAVYPPNHYHCNAPYHGHIYYTSMGYGPNTHAAYNIPRTSNPYHTHPQATVPKMKMVGAKPNISPVTMVRTVSEDSKEEASSPSPPSQRVKAAVSGNEETPLATKERTAIDAMLALVGASSNDSTNATSVSSMTSNSAFRSKEGRQLPTVVYYQGKST